jgi:lipopolysaccharide export system protein LptA
MENHRKKVSLLELRARLPLVIRILAIGGLAVTLLFVGVGFYRARTKPDFRLKSELAKLSKDVLAVVDGYERRETEDGIAKYYISADKATTFADQHQELENVHLELYSEGEKTDRISAAKGVYVPINGDPKNFNAHFFGAVNIETHDGLKIQTEQISYNRAEETATSEDVVNFSRENVSGKALGAALYIKEKKLELLQNVEVESVKTDKTEASPETDGTALPGIGGGDYERAKVTAGRATVWQEPGKIELQDNVQVNITPAKASGSAQVGSKPTEIKSARAVAYFVKEIEKIDLAENVSIISDPMAIHSAEATYFLKEGKVFLSGGAEVTQGSDLIKGDTITADLTADKKLKNGVVNGNAYLKTTNTDRQTEVNSNQMTVLFGQGQQIQNAVATGNVAVKSDNADTNVKLNSTDSLVLLFAQSAGKAVLQKMTSKGNSAVTMTPLKPEDYSQVTMSAPNSLEVLFRQNGDQSVVKEMTTGGRTVVTMSAPNGGDPKASNKKLTADSVKTFWNANGKDLTRTEATGNAELYVEPLKASPENYYSTVNGDRFDCDFYSTGNIAKTCIAASTGGGKPKVTMKPTQPSEERGVRTLTAARLTANFNQRSQDVERFDAAGAAKFSENDRRGTADTISYTAADEMVRLRGGEPMVWDSKARVRGGEIDWDTRAKKSYFRNKVSTTYYSQKQTDGAAPFMKTEAPVFITADRAEFDHQTEVGVYAGNARAWQDNNYVRADQLVLSQKTKRMNGNGKVQSVLYNAKRTENGKESNVPVYASAEQIAYSDEGKLLQYADKVDIRQGTDRIMAGNADIYLTQNNDLSRMTVERSVQITQPGKKATGDWAQYDAAQDSFILRGNPASVESAEEGSTQGAQLTIYKRENRVINEGSTKSSAPNRTRSVYKVKKP